MASLTCPDCGTHVPWNATGCAGCGLNFHEIRCTACNYVGLPDRFDDQRCPKCKKDQFRIVPESSKETDEVGAEAFVDDVPILTDIERSFSRSKVRKSPGTDSANAGQSDQAAPAKRVDADPRPVLTRQRWTNPQLSEKTQSSSGTPPDEKPVKKSIKQQPVTAKRRLRYTVQIPPKVQQILRWSAMGVPVVLILAIAIYLFGGRSGRRVRPHVADSTAMVDPAALEAQAMALYNAAVDYYRSGRVEDSITALQQVVSLFPITNAGAQARQALDRISQGKSPFDVNSPNAGAPSPDADPPPELAAAQPATDAPKKKAFIGVRGTPAGGEATATETQDGSNSPPGAATRPPGAPPQGSTLAKTGTTARALPDGFVAVADAGVDSSGWPIEIICLKDQSHMMLVPAGEFEMGNANAEPNARTVRRVRLKAYYIDRYEITLMQYRHFLEQRRLKGSPYRELSAAAQAAVPSDRHPVVGVAWRDANAYAEWSGKSLPTEAEWEKAGRGTDGRLVPWGTGSPNWEKPREPKQLDRVGSFAWDVSIYGCFDMAGNAWEWCADWYDPNIYNTDSWEDPQGPKASLPPVSFRDPEKVIRGGSPSWEVTWRGFSGIQEEPLHVGFRCVLEVEKIAPRTPPAGVVTEAPRQTQPQTAPRIPPGGYKF